MTALGIVALVWACGQAEDQPAEEQQPAAAAEEQQGVEEEQPAESQERATPASSVAADLQGTAPETYRARFETNEGDFVVEVHREWAPHGADRFYNLVSHGYYDGVRFFRVIDGFMAQFGIPGDPQVAAQVRNLRIPDDPVVEGNTRGRLTFAMAGPDTRTSQVFINFVDNSRLDSSGFAAFGEVVEGMDVVDSLYSDYGEGPPRGNGPNQARIQTEGNAYLESDFPELDYVERATIIEP
jgi:peptidyl-prolyl cis-trans isomerase A (cyclophilin A)